MRHAKRILFAGAAVALVVAVGSMAARRAPSGQVAAAPAAAAAAAAAPAAAAAAAPAAARPSRWQLGSVRRYAFESAARASLPGLAAPLELTARGELRVVVADRVAGGRIALRVQLD